MQYTLDFMTPIQPAEASATSSSAYVLAGLQAGMAAALVMLTWLGFTGMWFRHGFWRASNVLSMIFFGERGIESSFGMPTIAAVALQLLLYAGIGAMFAPVVSERLRALPLIAAGVATGIAVYFALFGFVWGRLNPLVPLYTHDRPMLVAHILYGGMLARFPKYLR